MTNRLSDDLRESARHPSVFARVYQARARSLLAFFVRRTFDVEVARDLAAETFAQAFEHRHRFRGRTDAEAEAWLYRIAQHQLSRYTRNGAVHRKAVDRLGIDVPSMTEDDQHRIIELAGLVDLRTRVSDALTSLPRDQREALQLRIVEERPYQDVAVALGVSEQAVRARVSRALRRLGEIIDTPTPQGVCQ